MTMWHREAEHGSFDPLAPQKALAAAIQHVTGDPHVTAEVMYVIGFHLYVTASEHLLSKQYQGYAQSCQTVASQLRKHTDGS